VSFGEVLQKRCLCWGGIGRWRQLSAPEWFVARIGRPAWPPQRRLCPQHIGGFPISRDCPSLALRRSTFAALPLRRATFACHNRSDPFQDPPSTARPTLRVDLLETILGGAAEAESVGHLAKYRPVVSLRKRRAVAV
jgi:hypothetical protein